ncbi:LacI family DNA-binding transcriptional regulator [Nocardia fluminea]|uniref:LacI family DNA-binding transcriptional regulator n=1 Tax=Nocardia fluminea TaxID=134984 RepID=UPI003810981C
MTRPAKRVTSADVALAAGVSRTTVSFVLNNRPGQSIPEETRRRIFDAAERLDYRPHAFARALASGRSDIVLLSIPDLPIGPGITRFVEELAAALADYGLTLVTHLAGAHAATLPDVCATIGASAVVGLEPFSEDVVGMLRRAGAEAVLPQAGRTVASRDPIGHAQARHLIDRGDRRIGYAMPTDSNLRAMAEDRYDGAAAACIASDLEPPVAVRTSLDVAAASDAVSMLLRHSVTGVCAFNDEVAMAILAGMRENGLTAPTDLAVIGADDIPTARLATPPLTTLAFDMVATGRQRADAVVAALAGEKMQVPPTPNDPVVIQRAST